jgi:predicted dehydrogenase
MPVRIGFVGVGDAAQPFLEALSNLDEARIVACVDSDRARAEAVARRFKAKAFADAKKMLTGDALDAVFVCTPAAQRRGAEILALQAGRDVFLDAPLASSSVKAAQIIKASQDASSRLWVAHPGRFAVSTEQLRKLLSARGASKPLACHGQWCMPPVEAKKRGANSNFLQSSTQLFDLLRYLLGEVVRVYARQTSTAMSLHVEFANGLLGTFVLVMGNTHLQNQLEIVTSNEVMQWRQSSLNVIRANETHVQSFDSNFYREECRAFLRACAKWKTIGQPQYSR